MSITLRVMLIIAAMFSCIYAGNKIKKAQMRIEDTLFWIVVSAGILILGIFPQIAMWLATKIGISSPVNLVYLVFIFILLFKVFILTVQVSQLQEKVKNLAQHIAIYEKEQQERRIEE